MPPLIIISGCSGGGKSTLIEALRRAGKAVVEEPGRRVIAAERALGGSALPWTDMLAFVRRIVDLSRADVAGLEGLEEPVFLDRGLIDAAVALEHLTGEPVARTIGDTRFHDSIFLTPPWPDIYAKDDDRRHDWGEAVAEYRRLAAAYPKLGYRVHLLPKASVAERLAFVLTETGGIRPVGSASMPPR